MALDFDKLKEYDDYLVIVKNSKTGEHIQGLIDNDGFSYSAGAELAGSAIGGAITDVTSGAMNKANDQISGGLGGANGRVAGAVGGFLKDNYKNIISTYKGYDGASDNGFSIQLHIFPGQSGYKETLLKVAKFTQPDTSNGGIIQSHLYSSAETLEMLAASDPFKGALIHVSIGDWFLATGLFCSGVDYNFSKYVDEKKRPMYLIMNLTFTTYKVLTAEELAGWIRK